MRAADVLLEECCKSDMKFTICWDDRGAFAASGQKTWRSSLDSTASVMEQEAALVEALEKDFVYLRDHYFDKSAYIRHGTFDEPVVCLLGPTKITKARVWDEVCKKVFPDLEKRPKLLAMQGSARCRKRMLLMLAYMRGYLEKCSPSVRCEVSGISWTTFMKIRRRSWGARFPRIGTIMRKVTTVLGEDSSARTAGRR